jgi:hypothetical protein
MIAAVRLRIPAWLIGHISDAAVVVPRVADGAVDACVPMAEVCNYKDDDCDGVVDPGLLQLLPSEARAWALDAGEIGVNPRVGVNLVPRQGGAWLLYSGLKRPTQYGFVGIADALCVREVVASPKLRDAAFMT